MSLVRGEAFQVGSAPTATSSRVYQRRGGSCRRCSTSRVQINSCGTPAGDILQAHAMPPHQGSGAGQAIEVGQTLLLATSSGLKVYLQDAYMLSSILGHPSVTLANLPQALKAYEHVRLPFANHILNASNNAGKLCQLRSIHRENEETLAPAFQGQWGWVDSEDPETQFQRALRWMNSENRQDGREEETAARP